MIKQGYNDLVHAIIRPPRCTYQEHHLGPRHFSFAGKQFQRIDYELLNPRGLKIVCSLWEPVPECRNNPILPCVIYMHGNSSARVEALTQLSLVLAMGATCVSFDFTGSGKSGGEWVSLGAYEKEDLKVSRQVACFLFAFVTSVLLCLLHLCPTSPYSPTVNSPSLHVCSYSA